MNIGFIELLIIISALISFFAVGVGIGHYQWFPYSAIKNIKKRLLDPHPVGPKELHQLKNSTSYPLKTSSLLPEPKTIDNEIKYSVNEEYQFHREINTKETAIVIMDPWATLEECEKVIDSYIIPLVNAAYSKGHAIIVLTSDIRLVGGHCRLHPKILSYVENGMADVIYHQWWDDVVFASFLRGQGINSLIYVGFHINACVLRRRTGIIKMNMLDFKTYFVPEASLALEHNNQNVMEEIGNVTSNIVNGVEVNQNIDDQPFHKEATKTIMRYFGEKIEYDNIMKALYK